MFGMKNTRKPNVELSHNTPSFYTNLNPAFDSIDVGGDADCVSCAGALRGLSWLTLDFKRHNVSRGRADLETEFESDPQEQQTHVTGHSLTYQDVDATEPQTSVANRTALGNEVRVH
jgi:hypothetical protein